MATTNNLGRVQGGGFYASTSYSETDIPVSSVTVSNVSPLVGDTIVNADGAACRITAISGSEYIVTKYGTFRPATSLDTDAVHFTPQTLTAEQQGQARANINAQVTGDYATKDELPSTADDLNKIAIYGYVMSDSKVIDATGLDENKWYPVTVQLEHNENIRIEVYAALGDGDIPSWSTHANGFSCCKIWETNASGWGSQPISRRILVSHYDFTTSNPIRNIGQIYQISQEYFYVRGGGKYIFHTSHETMPVLHPDGYNWTSGSYSESLPVLDTEPEESPITIVDTERDQMIGGKKTFADGLTAKNYNDFIMRNNEFNFVPSGHNDTVYLNFRGYDNSVVNITSYKFCAGKGEGEWGSLADIYCADGNIRDKLIIDTTSTENNYDEGLRINSDTGWSTISLGTDRGTNYGGDYEKGIIVGRPPDTNYLVIAGHGNQENDTKRVRVANNGELYEQGQRVFSPNNPPTQIIAKDGSNPIFDLPLVSAEDIEPSHNTILYMKELLKWICRNYPGIKGGLWIGRAVPNSAGTAIIDIYDTDKVNSEGLPQYSTGTFRNIGNDIFTFHTINYEYKYRYSDEYFYSADNPPDYVRDYGNDSSKIYIGYYGSPVNKDDFLQFAAYINYNGTYAIKDMSATEARKVLGVGSYAESGIEEALSNGKTTTSGFTKEADVALQYVVVEGIRIYAFTTVSVASDQWVRFDMHKTVIGVVATAADNSLDGYVGRTATWYSGNHAFIGCDTDGPTMFQVFVMTEN